MLLYCEPCELMLCMLSEMTNLGLLSENPNKDDQQRTLCSLLNTFHFLSPRTQEQLVINFLPESTLKDF